MAYEIPIALEYTHTHWPSPLLVLRIIQSILFIFINLLHLDILCVYKYCCISMCEHKAWLIALDFINFIYTECIFLVCCFFKFYWVIWYKLCFVCVRARESMFVLCKYQQANSGLLPLFVFLNEMTPLHLWQGKLNMGFLCNGNAYYIYIIGKL